MEDDWLTVEGAAELSGYHPNHIRRLIRAGEIEAKRFGFMWAISRESLLEYIEKSTARGEKTGPKPSKSGSKSSE